MPHTDDTTSFSSSNTPIMLPQPAFYFPINKGRYDVTAGLRHLGVDFGNGPSDSTLFQIDHNWFQYRQEKLQSRSESLTKYVCRSRLEKKCEQAVNQRLLTQLAQDYPDYFHLEPASSKEWILHCLLSKERLIFSPCYEFLGMDSKTSISKPRPPYISGLDAIACQIQEDIAITSVTNNEPDYLSALHLCFPNHWAAEDKIGLPFDAVHKNIPNFEKISKQSPSLLNTLVNRGPFVRFAWGLATDQRLNHHPRPPHHYTDPKQWNGRCFDIKQPTLYLRIERQVTVGLPETHAFIFTIRTYFINVYHLATEQLNNLTEAINTMSPATLKYKGIDKQRNNILQWLNELGMGT